MLSAFLGFLVLVVGLGSAFALSHQGGAGATDYRALVLGPDAPLTVVADPPTPAQPPFSVSTISGAAASIALSLPGLQAGSLVLQAVESTGADPLTAQALRSTSAGTGPDGASAPYISVGLMLDAGYQQLLGMTPDGSVIWYDPPVLQLPADLTPGFTWAGDGMTLDFAPYTLTGSVLPGLQLDEAPGPVERLDGCTDVRTVLDQQIPGAEGFVTERVTTWCSGWGSVASRNVGEDVFTRLALPGDVDWPEATTTSPRPRPAGTEFPFPVPVSSISFPPVDTEQGLIMVNGSLGDLVALTMGEPGEDGIDPGTVLSWMQHPGGTVLGVAADDDRIFVTTSRRVLQCFDAIGRLRWSAPLPDVAVGGPVVLGGVVAMAGVDGAIRGFDAQTGEQAWSARLSDVLSSAPVSAGGLIAAADTAGYAVAVDEQGVVAWSAGLESVGDPLSGFADGSVLIPQRNGTLTLVDARGDERWSTSLDGASVNGTAVQHEDVLLVPTDAGVLGLDMATGQVRWTLPGLNRASVAPSGLVADGSQVLSVSGSGATESVATVLEADGQTPQRLFLSRLAGQSVAVTQEGAVTFLGVPGD